MNKLFSLFCFLLCVLTSAAQEKNFVLNGTIPVSPKKYNVLLSWNNGATAEEAKVVNGKFTIKGAIEAPVFATLSLQEANPPASKKFNFTEYLQNELELFLDGGTITVVTKTTLNNAEVKGAGSVNDYYSYTQQVKGIKDLQNKLNEVYYNYANAKNKRMLEKLPEVYEKLSDVFHGERLEFVKQRPSSFVSLFFAKQALGMEMDAAKAEPMFQLLHPALQASEEGKELGATIAIAKKSMIGEKAADFTQPDANGNMISLSSFKGKYVLVDFWASWCGPCREESPNLVKVYEQYKHKNFEIFTVSLDEKKDRWLKAVKDDAYTWPQAGDMKGWENTAATQYGITGIPFNFLLDPNGVIIARNLRGEELDKRLAEILK